MGSTSEAGSGVVSQAEFGKVMAALHLRLVNLEARNDALVHKLKEVGIMDEEDVNVMVGYSRELMDRAVRNGGSIPYEDWQRIVDAFATDLPGAGVRAPDTGAHPGQGDTDEHGSSYHVEEREQCEEAGPDAEA